MSEVGMHRIWNKVLAVAAFCAAGGEQAWTSPLTLETRSQLINLPAPDGLATAALPRADVLWEGAEVEGDARSLLADAIPGAVVQSLVAYPYEPGPGVSGYVTCGAIRRANEVAGFAVFHVATEETVGFVRAGGPIVEGSRAHAASSSELVWELCRRAGLAGTTTAVSFTCTEPRAR
ncbi:hypothetical protein [Falsiroseomonas sp.]|uniref:hypothetical protein n=1 Tax=Falsiroseomonas sp. TaxID=2870721 RepID=UPI0027363DB6|nr:hypothetical protein [Falsiroseomonas sp.]MDP3416670.1 hypothetical protein [Falsiroseomonas sp.]